MPDPNPDRKALIAQIAQRQAAQRNFMKSTQVNAMAGGKVSQMKRDVDDEVNKLQTGWGSKSKHGNPFLD
jgi:hypothetical protein